jgi:UDP-N-acetylglucosamine acyltransferase
MIYMDNYTMFMREMYDPKDEAHLHDSSNNFIHETAIVGESVKLGRNNYIGAFCNIVGDTVIGNNNRFEAYCSIGTYPEHKTYFEQQIRKGVVIGSNNVFREFVTINAGTIQDTILEDYIWMLRGSHVGHDSLIRSYCTLSCNVLIGGHSVLGADVNMGLGSICHQYSVIGGGAMIGMGCILTKKSIVKPLETHVGNPAKFIAMNDYKVNKATTEQIEVYTSIYNEDLIKMKKLLEK